jgi:alpha/beta superfamily hydrolase
MAATRHIMFASAGEPSVQLEGVLSAPPAALQGIACPAVVLCHPQPATSSLDDPLIARLDADLAGRGFVTLRFNFRSVGASGGQSSDGRLEPLDVAGAVSYLLGLREVDPSKVALVGHAFGACMALAYARFDPRVGAVVAISPPVFRLSRELQEYTQPVLFVTGEYDEVCPEFKLAPLVARLPRLEGIRVVPGSRHLMRGHEAAVAEIVVRSLVSWATAPRPPRRQTGNSE